METFGEGGALLGRRNPLPLARGKTKTVRWRSQHCAGHVEHPGNVEISHSGRVALDREGMRCARQDTDELPCPAEDDLVVELNCHLTVQDGDHLVTVVGAVLWRTGLGRQ